MRIRDAGRGSKTRVPARCAVRPRPPGPGPRSRGGVAVNCPVFGNEFRYSFPVRGARALGLDSSELSCDLLSTVRRAGLNSSHLSGGNSARSRRQHETRNTKPRKARSWLALVDWRGVPLVRSVGFGALLLETPAALCCSGMRAAPVSSPCQCLQGPASCAVCPFCGGVYSQLNSTQLNSTQLLVMGSTRTKRKTKAASAAAGCFSLCPVSRAQAQA